MALIKCPECGKEISSEAISCPHCGFPIKKKPLEDPIPRIIAIRGEPGSVKGVIIFDFIAGVLFIIGAILAIIFTTNTELYPISYLGSFVGAFGVLAVIVGIQGFVRMSMNNKNIHPCIEYDKEKDELHLYKINGEKITITPDKYVSLKDNFFTDNILYFTYFDYRGRRLKVNLGYCANRDEIRAPIEKLRNRSRY